MAWTGMEVAAVIAALGALTSAPFMAWQTNRNARQKEERDHKRQDQVAEQAAQAAALLLERQDRIAAETKETARLLKENNAAVAASTAETHGQLREIRTLVDGTLTAAMESDFGATMRDLASLRENVLLKEQLGHTPNNETAAAIDAAVLKLAALRKTIEDRNQQMAAAEAAADSQAARRAAPS